MSETQEAVGERLLMIPGPVPVAKSIREALAQPTLGHRDPQFVAHFRSALHKLPRLVDGADALPVIVAGSGTLAMEMALLNTLPAQAPILIATQGVFGDRMRQITDTLGLETDEVRAEMGQAVTPEQLQVALQQRRYNAVTLTHVDTSTGTMVDLRALAGVIKAQQPEALILVDGVCATGGVPEYMDAWDIDLILAGSQKALGLPPGLALLIVGPRAQAARRALARVPSYYGDWERWRPIMENPDGYFATPATNLVVALDQALAMIFEEGPEARFARHEAMARVLRRGLVELGFESFAATEHQAPTLSVLRYPSGVDAGQLLRDMYNQGIVIADGIGKLAGQVCRIGHMGNIGAREILQVVDTAERVLGGGRANGSAMRAARAALQETGLSET